MESDGSKMSTNTNQSPPVLVHKRQRVVLEEFPDLSVPPGYQPIQNSNLDEPIGNKSNVKRDNQQIDEPYVSDISLYLRMMEIEENRKPAVDYVENVQKHITTNMRATLVDWLVEVADEYKLLSETLHLAVSYIDRFLSIHSLNRSELQLLGVSAMLIASKYEETTPPKAADFCQKMEAQILKTLNYEMGNPNVVTFLRRFIAIASENRKTSNSQFENLCNYLADLSLLDYECIQFKPSTVAASVIFLAKFIIKPRVHPWTLSLYDSLVYGSDDLEDCVIILHDLYLSKRASSLKAIRDKYKKKKFKCVANLPSRPELPERYFEEVHGE
ncbi:hypothetical protein KIW84_051407 [Lathyrus oleraceus]|uniref:B-like cyclin n=1 Tax=Pisum sativum TaxID=3888 RepID=A0A9D5AAM2_PEA|nr:hypothetical protein KIW84_051407 [Pisum sativum]